MLFRAPHGWSLTPSEATEVQRRLASSVEARDRFGRLRRVAGVDVGLDRERRTVRAAVAVLSWPSLDPVEHAICEQALEFPYVPGLLSFRELPAVLTALRQLQRLPDLVLCDGQGYAHPRRFGLACHLGVVTGLPTIGVAKSRLIGSYQPPGRERGSRSPLMDGGEIVGMVVRTRTGVRPVFVSVGHRVGLETAVDLVLEAAPRYRLPETTRWAHRLASAAG